MIMAGRNTAPITRRVRQQRVEAGAQHLAIGIEPGCNALPDQTVWCEGA